MCLLFLSTVARNDDSPSQLWFCRPRVSKERPSHRLLCARKGFEGADVCGHPRDAETIDFDDGNESELAGHGITALEVFQLVTNDPTWVPNRKGRAGLWLAVGHTDGGRALTVPVAYCLLYTSD